MLYLLHVNTQNSSTPYAAGRFFFCNNGFRRVSHVWKSPPATVTPFALVSLEEYTRDKLKQLAKTNGTNVPSSIAAAISLIDQKHRTRRGPTEAAQKEAMIMVNRQS